MQWSILECLVLNAGRVVSKDKLMSAISSWSDEITPNAIEVYVSRLRAKLGIEHETLIGTVRNVGYRFEPPRDRREETSPPVGALLSDDDGSALPETPPARSTRA